jgi:hypothetical protein
MAKGLTTPTSVETTPTRRRAGAVEELADALLPLLRAHDAQVWDEGERAGHTNANPYRHLIRNPYRDRAEQDTPDQANT